MEKKTVRDINVKGKKVLVRVDYNVPMNDKGEITDTIRIDATLPTLNYLLDQGAAIILMAHLGRPKGKVVPSMSLKPYAEYLSQVMKKEVKFPTASARRSTKPSRTGKTEKCSCSKTSASIRKKKRTIWLLPHPWLP